MPTLAAWITPLLWRAPYSDVWPIRAAGTMVCDARYGTSGAGCQCSSGLYVSFRCYVMLSLVFKNGLSFDGRTAV